MKPRVNIIFETSETKKMVNEKEWEVRKEKCFEAEDEKFNCCYIEVETLIEYPGQMSSRKMQELGK